MKSRSYGSRAREYGELSAIDRILLAVVLFSSVCVSFSAVFGVRGAFATNGFVSISLAALLMLCFHFRELSVDKGLKTFLIFTLLCAGSSTAMSLLLANQIGSMFGETPLTTGLPSICWLFFNLLMVVYFSWSYAKTTGVFLDKVFDALVVFTLVISFAEIALGSALSGILSNWITNYDAILSTGRIPGIGSEPASMAPVLGLFCLPYCYARFKDGGNKLYLAAFAVLVIVAFFTQSSTVFVTVIIVCVAILLRGLSSSLARNSGYFAIAICFVLLVFMCYCLFQATSGGGSLQASIEHVLGRVGSTTDQSGAYRNSTIINDWKIFIEYPILGVGDGNQGYFYAQNMPSWILNAGSVEVANALAGSTGVLDGGAFIGSLVSGYGIVGIALFAVWFIGLLRKARKKREKMGHYYDMYIIALCGSIPVLWMGLGFKGAPVAAFAIFCLPYLSDRLSTSYADDGADIVAGDNAHVD